MCRSVDWLMKRGGPGLALLSKYNTPLSPLPPPPPPLPQDPELPAGWEMRKTKEGVSYYVDHNTRTTHWVSGTSLSSSSPSHDHCPLQEHPKLARNKTHADLGPLPVSLWA